MSDIRYVRATGALSAMVRFLVDDLEEAVAMLDSDDWRIGNFEITIKHAKQCMAEAAESGAIDTVEYRQDNRKVSGKVKTATGYVEEPTTESIHEYAGDLGSNKP